MKSRFINSIILSLTVLFFACEEPCPLVKDSLTEPADAIASTDLVNFFQDAVYQGVRVVAVTYPETRGLCDALPDCDKALEKWSYLLQQKAEASGEVLYMAIDCCIDGQAVCITIVAYPKIAVDAYFASADLTKEEGPDGKSFGWDFDLVISRCADGKPVVQVKPYPGTVDNFHYKWLLDGEYAGDDYRITCVCGTKASVGVSLFPGGKILTKGVLLPVCVDYADDRRLNFSS